MFRQTRTINGGNIVSKNRSKEWLFLNCIGPGTNTVIISTVYQVTFLYYNKTTELNNVTVPLLLRGGMGACPHWKLEDYRREGCPMSVKAGERYKVLLVDTESERKAYKKSAVFEEQGFEISDEVSDLGEAINKLEHADFDIVFTGSGIPLADSLKIARLAKEKSSSKTVVISTKEAAAEQPMFFGCEHASGTVNPGQASSGEALQKGFIFKSLLKNDMNDRQEFLSSAEKIGFSQSERKCTVMLIPAGTPEKEEVFSNEDYELMERALNEALERDNPANEGNIAHISLSMNNSFIVMTQNSRVDTVIETLSSLCDELAIDYLIGISTPFDQMEYIPISYREAHEAIIRCKPEQKINTFNAENNKENDELRRMAEVTSTIIRALETGTHQRIPNILETFFADLEKCAPDTALNLCINSINTILGYFGINEMDKFKIKYRFDLVGPSKKEIYNSIKATYHDNITRILQIIKNTPGGLAECIIKKVQDMVVKDYSKPDLSLCSISQALNISYCYLSKIFKQKTGSSFVNYLTSVRMMNAKRLLLDGGLRINEVSNAVGYSSSAYFITAFRKFFDISPGDYKVRIAGGEQQSEAKNVRNPQGSGRIDQQT